MKKKYQNILMDSANLVGKIPGVNMTGATATTSVYISAYSDYHETCQFLGIIANNIKLIDSLESTINKYKNVEGYDIEELKGQIDWSSEKVDKAYEELKEYISKRENQHWK